MKFRLKDIQPNPFRHLETYPIKPDKVAALVASMEQTGFWDNVVGRLNSDGKPEMAYGHHRWEAARKALGPNAVIDLIIKDLDDETMIKVMANENMNEWGTSATVEQETIRAVVEAFAAGQIKLDRPSPSTKVLRIAPKYEAEEVLGRRRQPSVINPRWSYTTPFAYSETTVAQFLGWTDGNGTAHPKVHNALDALALIEEELLDTEDFIDLGTTHAAVVVEQTKKRLNAKTSETPTQKKKAARRVGKQVADALRRGARVIDQADAAESDIRSKRLHSRELPTPSLTQEARQLSHQLNGLFGPTGHYALSLQHFVDDRSQLSTAVRTDLVKTLIGIAALCTKTADQLESQPRFRKHDAIDVSTSEVKR